MASGRGVKHPLAGGAGQGATNAKQSAAHLAGADGIPARLTNVVQRSRYSIMVQVLFRQKTRRGSVRVPGL
jgi:hypothetical protein